MALPPALHSRYLSWYGLQGLGAYLSQLSAFILLYLFSKRIFSVPAFIINILTGTYGDSTHIATDLGTQSLRTLSNI